ncbi:MAG: bifunctional [glutamate--ammonia ligase]-adenylyl-L-tyrosine phosphorylase/[glutamate--ammonia-ligase] adenylyltransferase [Verrucomicrobia bacterium]|nr:bifunctional [glutamate--ammonia ligase]-adenylyl-L-tyrosine phosphorylase/[glutamate--ammonia-ligase] adenylyltransferase [Verrucomicrobiota bacterium]
MPKSSLPNSAWKKAVKAAADPERAERFAELLLAGAAITEASEEQTRILCALFSGSQVLSEQLLQKPEWLALVTPENLAHPRRDQGLRNELYGLVQPCLDRQDYAGVLGHVRRFKQREMLRVAARDLARLARTEETIREISDVADACLAAVFNACWLQLTERFGRPYHQDAAEKWQPTGFAVLGLGKLGGQELNYSSDVDVMFVYDDEGGVFKGSPGKNAKPVLTDHQFFTRLAEAFIAEVRRLTPDGALFRIDLRLRPEGDTGPLVRSLAGYENYYAQWGQTWERMMLIKARGVAGSVSLAGEFLELVQTFRFPRSLTEHALGEMAAMKQRIEDEIVKSGELDRNVKLGRGGIREIEFITQTLQMLHGGKNPFLHGAQTLPMLDKLVQYKLLPEADAVALKAAYCFLRDVEHRCQMDQNRQTHIIPLEASARERLARLMDFKGWKNFEAARAAHSGRVRALYDRLLKAESANPAAMLPREFEAAESEWRKLLPNRSFRDPDKAFKLLKEFALGPGYGHISGRTTDLAWRLIPKFLSLCPARATPDVAGFNVPADQEPLLGTDKLPPHLSDPDRVLARLDTFISEYGARATLYEVWANNPSLFGLLLLLFDRSEFLAEVAIRTPDMVEELMLSGHLRRRKAAAEILKELQHGQDDPDQRMWLRRYHKSEFMRVGLRHILGLADHEQNFEELSALADACLQYALEIVLRRVRRKTPPFAIIGLGKLGGCELNYGSDLDIIFVAPSATRNLSALQKLAAQVMDLLSGATELGVAFATDARLRPDGEKGLLVNTLEAYEDYYRRRAMLWEIQSLTRLRPVAGDLAVGQKFLRLAAALTDFRPANVAAGFPFSVSPVPVAASRQSAADGVDETWRRSAETPLRLTGSKAGAVLPRTGLHCYAPDWKQSVHKMRRRVEQERTPKGKEALAFKTGAGGLMDAEFMAQALCLEHGWQEASTLRALLRAQAEGALPSEDAASLIDNYRQLRRMEAILRRWSYEGEDLLPDDPAALYRVAVRCGWRNAEEFMRALAGWRAAVREIYMKFFKPPPVGVLPP